MLIIVIEPRASWFFNNIFSHSLYMRNTNPLFLLFCFLFASSYVLHSQCAMQGKLADAQQAPISFNAIALINHNDSSIVKGVITDIDGNYCFESIKKGTYQLKISAIGFATYYSDKIEYDSITSLTIPNINLQAGGVNLNEVSIAAQKKVVEFKNGNII